MKKIPLEEAQEIANEIIRRYQFKAFKTSAILKPVGSIARHAPLVKDIDFLLISNEPIDQIIRLPKTETDKILDEEIPEWGDKRITMNAITEDNNYKVDFFITSEKELPFALYHYIGPKSYNIRIRAYAKKLGYKLNQYGLYDAKTGREIPGIKTQKQLAQTLNVTYRKPQERQ